VSPSDLGLQGHPHAPLDLGRHRAGRHGDRRRFRLIWQIWWLAILGIVSIIGTAIFHTFNYDRSYHIHAEHIAEVEAARTAQLAAAAKKEPLHEQSRQHPVTGDLTAAYYDLNEHAHPDGYSTGLGFWLYLMSDCLIFAMLFATFGVLGGNYAGGEGPKDLFNLRWWR
jgi:hypothetical protein